MPMELWGSCPFHHVDYDILKLAAGTIWTSTNRVIHEQGVIDILLLADVLGFSSLLLRSAERGQCMPCEHRGQSEHWTDSRTTRLRRCK